MLLIVLTLTAGTALLMWMGELVTQRGIGNGMSLLIFASVVSTLPVPGRPDLRRQGLAGGADRQLVVFDLLLVAIVFVEQGQRRIPVQFAKRVVGRRMYGGQSTYIPLKVNQSGVIPIIFASSVLYLPQLLIVVLPADQAWAVSVQQWVDRQPRQPHLAGPPGRLRRCSSSASPTSTRPSPSTRRSRPTRIRKQGGFIPGIRPGPQTERYLAKILSRITLPGALFIAAIALVPSLVLTQFLDGQQVSFSGISILIAVGVALETMKQIDSQLMMRNYEGFLK